MIINRRVPFKFLLNEIKVQLFTVALLGVTFGLLPYYLPDYAPDISIQIATTLGIAISILLSYKINQSYNRWWEARTIWGAIVNDSRSLILQLQLYVKTENVDVAKISHYQIGWCRALERSLRRQEIWPVLEDLLSEEEIKKLREHSNVPLAISQLQNGCLKKLYDEKLLNEFALLQIEKTLNDLVASMGRAERIKNTVFPPTFGQILHAAIYLFAVFLSLSSSFHLNIVLQVVILISVSMMFFFLEMLAHRLQDPFSNSPTDTPMTALSRTIEINIRQLLNEKEIPDPIEPQGFYLM
jgi:ion channel-forming bestrophin family protein